ncbi:MAG: ribulose-phosphate 3-epimerase [Desulfobacterales bacterium CG23_combo_of_CG06-09_8_20_14_all_51_8]|nr:MAG: ribulose-phosphate 3-epimerase [Desulfobacterales bacterium CG23_combo_of_CG06-09_8_20_14_all_51_8]
MKLIAPSILSADFTILGDEIRHAEAAGADWIHIDVMDGHFVPNITMGPMIVGVVNKITDLPLDVHLMIETPDNYIQDFAHAGADLISVHVETCPHLNRTIDLIRCSDCQAGVVLNPATSLDTIEWVLEYVDLVLLMSVNPGFGGQSFIPNTIEKIERLKQMIDAKGLPTLIQVDGGVNEKTIARISSAGADVFVAGSAIFGTGDYKKSIKNLKDRF